MSSPLTKAAGGIGCAVIALPLLVALTIAAALGSGTSGGSVSAAPSKHAVADIPAHMLAL